MTYASLLSSEGINSQYLIVLKPRRILPTSWTNISGTYYKQTFDYGEIQKLYNQTTLITEATSLLLVDGDWFYDITTEVLYIDIGSNPALVNIVGVYDIYLGTLDAFFNQNPTDSSSRVVYYEPLISRSPNISSSSGDYLFGFLPSYSNSIEISNATRLMQRHLYDSSFNQAEVGIYHYLGSLDAANIRQVFLGFCGNISSDDSSISLEIFDRNSFFDKDFRHISGQSFFGATAFPGLDPEFVARPVRRLYGFVDGYIPTNIDYVKDSPTTSDNRTWIVSNPETNLGTITTTVPASPVSTTTRTYLASANGMQVGDTVYIDSASGPAFDERFIVGVVNKTGSHYVEHAAITNAAASGSVAYRSFVGGVAVIQNGTVYSFLYNRDYIEYTDGTNKVAGFTLLAAAEANVGAATINITSDIVYCRVYGNKNSATIGGSPFGSNSALTGTLTNPVVIIYELLKSYLGLSEADIDTAQLISLAASVTDDIGFAVPALSTEEFYKYRDIIASINQTALLKIFTNTDNEWSLVQTMPTGAVDKSIGDDEILDGSFNYSISYKDIISDVIVNYYAREVSDKNEKGDLAYRKVSSNSAIATGLHKINKQKTFSSLHITSAQAQDLADHLKYVFGDRLGTASISTKNRLFDTLLNDVIQINRDKLPGFAFVQGTNQTRDFSVLSTNKTLDRIVIELDDQKGIEDNSGSW